MAVSDNEVLLPETTLEFLVTVKDAAFFNYTALTLIPRKIYEFILQSKDPDSDDRPPIIKAYRYKENVPVLSNLTGASRGIGQNRSLFLSQKFPALQENDLVEFLVLSDNGLLQLTSDQPGAETQQLAKADDLPIYIHQADVPPIVPPAGLTGVPTKGLKLDDNIPDDVFVFIQLSAVRNDDDDYSFINKDTGQAKEEKSHPVFQVRFKNRSTIWQYLNKNDKSLNSEEPNPLPFTYFGSISSTKGKPSEGSVKALKTDPSNKTRITKLVSEIFI